MIFTYALTDERKKCKKFRYLRKNRLYRKQDQIILVSDSDFRMKSTLILPGGGQIWPALFSALRAVTIRINISIDSFKMYPTAHMLDPKAPRIWLWSKFYNKVENYWIRNFNSWAKFMPVKPSWTFYHFTIPHIFFFNYFKFLLMQSYKKINIWLSRKKLAFTLFTTFFKYL